MAFHKELEMCLQHAVNVGWAVMCSLGHVMAVLSCLQPPAVVSPRFIPWVAGGRVDGLGIRDAGSRADLSATCKALASAAAELE